MVISPLDRHTQTLWSQLLNCTPNHLSQSFAGRMRNNLLARSPTVERTFWNSGLPGDFAERVARLFDARPERIGIRWDSSMRPFASLPRDRCGKRLLFCIGFLVQERLRLPATLSCTRR
jgi:hypothetical protein